MLQHWKKQHRNTKISLVVLGILTLLILVFLTLPRMTNLCCRNWYMRNYPRIREEVGEEYLDPWNDIRTIRWHFRHISGIFQYSALHFSTQDSDEEILHYLETNGCVVDVEKDYPEYYAVEYEFYCDNHGIAFLTFIDDPQLEVNIVTWEQLFGGGSFSDLWKCCFTKPEEY